MRPSRFIAGLAGLLVQFLFVAIAQSSFPPTPPVKLAVNPVTNKVYVTNTDANSVTAFDMNAGTSTTIAVGAGPSFIAVNPETNRVFVNNGRDASLTMIDGATDTPIGTFPIGSTGPITVNTQTGIVYIVRLTGTGSDEVTFFNAATDAPTWYTIATNSFQPNAMAINPATNTIFVTHYATGDVRVISGAFNPNDDFPASVSVGVFSHPFAVAANPVTNKAYIITQDARGPISIIDGATNDNFIPTIPPGHARNPQAVVVNPVTNRIYAAFAGEVAVIDGATNALTFVPIPNADVGPLALALNVRGNRILVASAQGSLSIIDGDTNTVATTTAIAAGTSVVGYNPLTDTAYFFDTALTSLAGTGGTVHTVPLATSITPFPGNSTSSNGTVTFNATSGFSPNAPAVRKVFYRIDAGAGPWLAASGSGPFTATLPNLANGSHTITAFAVDSQEASLATGPQSMPVVGPLATYAFTVAGARNAASVSLASSANPSAIGQSVVFTASVSGAAGAPAPTGTVTFNDGTTAVCSAVALANGSATCASSTLAAGTHGITAQYSGDTAYDPAVSSAVSQVVAKAAATATLASSINPATVGTTVTFTATISGGAGTPTGSVAFLDGTTAIATCSAVTLANGTATCATSALIAGTHSITARYAGDGTYNTVTSAAVSEVINKAASSVALASSANPSLVGQSVTLTATVGGSAGTPDGTVTFFDGGTAISGCASLALANGAAACTTSGLVSGVHPVSARYSGSATYNASASTTLNQAVNAPAKVTATVALASSANPSIAGTSVTFTATVSGGSGTPTGTVSFLSDAAVIAGCANVALAAGTAGCSTSTLAQGTHAVTAQYSGDATYNPAASSALSQAVAAAPQPRADLSAAVSASANAAHTGDNVTFAITVANAGPDAASGVTITANLPAGTTLVSASAGCTAASGSVSCDVGTLATATTLQVALVLQANAVGNITVTANVRANEADPATGNNAASATVAIDTNQVAPPSSVVNLSTRGRVGVGNDVMIGGFVIGGNASKTVVVVAQGPSLAAAGITDTLANPRLTLVRSADQSVLAVNDDWGDAPNAPAIQAAGFAPGNARESAIMMTLPPGAYTAIVDDASGGTGVGIVAVFEVDHPEVPLVDIATRGQVLTGNDVMIGGFIIQGSAPQTVIVTGTGPSLAQAGIADALANPTLTLVRSSDQSIVATNDDWGDAPNAADIQSAGFAPANARESAIMVTLPPGAYTAILSGAGGGTGVGLVAVFRP